MVFFYFYFVFGALLLCVATVLLVTILVQFRLREKYNVFSVKFLVDIVTAICLMVLGCLDRSAANGCGALLVISTSIPLVQTLLLLSEVIDWSLAAFSPVYFHSSSLFSRILPFLVGVVFSTIIMAALIVIDSTADKSLCVSSPTETAVISAYDISLVLASICLIALAVLLKKSFRSSIFKPIAFHFIATFLLQEIPLILLIVFKYSGQPNIVTITDITNILVAVHSLLHTAYFVYNHEDIRQGCRATFLHFHILSSIQSRS